MGERTSELACTLAKTQNELLRRQSDQLAVELEDAFDLDSDDDPEDPDDDDPEGDDPDDEATEDVAYRGKNPAYGKGRRVKGRPTRKPKTKGDDPYRSRLVS